MSGNTIAKNKGKSRVILIPQKLCDVLLDYAAWIGISHGPIFIARGPEQCVESDAEAVQGSWSARGKSISP